MLVPVTVKKLCGKQWGSGQVKRKVAPGLIKGAMKLSKGGTSCHRIGDQMKEWKGYFHGYV